MIRKSKFFAWMMAALASIIFSTTVSAQTLQPVDRQAEARAFNIEYVAPATTVTKVRLAPGLDIDPRLVPMLQECGFAYGPYALMQPVMERAERNQAESKKGWEAGWCSKKLIEQVDTQLGKESTLSFGIWDVPGGYETCALRKATNRGNNRDRCTFFARSVGDIGLGQFTDVDRATGGDTAVGDVLGAVLTGSVNNLTGAGAQRLFGGCNGGSGCGKGNVITVSASADGGDAYAEGGDAAAGAQSSSTLNQTGTGGTCGTSPCGSANPNHTQNGPQGP